MKFKIGKIKIEAKGDNVVALSIIVEPIYSEIYCVFAINDYPVIQIISPRIKDEIRIKTEIVFKNYKGWEVWSYSMNEDTLYVCLVKLNETH